MVLERWRPRVLRPWRPMEEIERLADAMLFDWPLRQTWRRFPGAEMGWAPSVEMYEKGDSFIVRAELPGMKSEDVDISVTGDTLTITGERKAAEEVKEEDYHRCELCYGAFSRSIAMPAAVNVDEIEAIYENGILEIHLPKAKEAIPAKVKVKAK